MDNLFTLIIKYAGNAFVKRCSFGYRRDELAAYACSKFNGLTVDNICIKYDLRGHGELSLMDDEDMENMFECMEEMRLKFVNVFLTTENGQHSGINITSGMQAFNEVGVEDFSDLDEDASRTIIHHGVRLRSEEWRDLIVGVKQCFPGGVVEFRKALAKYSVIMRFEYAYVKNDPSRVIAECKWKQETGCKWRIRASKDNADNTFYLRSYQRTHTCNILSSDESRINASIIADLVVDDIKAMPSITPCQVRTMVKKNFGVNISYTVAWKATDKARSYIFGDHTESFTLLRPYFEEAGRTNPGTCYDIDIDEENKFKRCFFAFGASLEGFKHCRPLLVLDGTFLKGKHKGILLSAVGKDGNEGLFPIAFAVVSEETDDNWEYFLSHLKVAVQDNRKIVFISDRNHGILEGVRNVFPDSPHGYCYVHLRANLKDRFRGCKKIMRKKVLKYFAKCAYASTKNEFGKSVQKFLDEGGEKATLFLQDTPKEKWSNAYFEGQRYGHMTSNACESWNSQIRDIRRLPITTGLIDGIRSILMQQMCKRRQLAATWTTMLTKNVQEKMLKMSNEARGWDVMMSMEHIYEVYSTPHVVVDVKEKTCTCRLWQVKGLPCVHASAVIFLNLKGDTKYIDHYFLTDSYKQTYAPAIFPFTIPENAGEFVELSPPDHHQRRGRPKLTRHQSSSEKTKKRIRCGNCKELGHHNKQSCPKKAA